MRHLLSHSQKNFFKYSSHCATATVAFSSVAPSVAPVFPNRAFLRQNTSGIPRQSTSGFTTPAVAFCHKVKKEPGCKPAPRSLSLIVSFFPCSEYSQYSAVFCVTFWQVSSDPLQPFPGDFLHFLLRGTAEDTPASARCLRIAPP